MKTIGIPEYCDLLRSLPCPTNIQIEAFIHHVVGQHQWFRMLPLTPPGVPFYFYINNGAGIDDLEDGTEHYRYDIHTLGAPGSSWISLTDYRRNYGWLRFHHNTGSNELPNTWVLDENNQKVMLDESILGLCRVELTGAMHYRCIDPLFWTAYYRLSPRPLNVNQWPEESGGSKRLKKIIKCSNEYSELQDKWVLSYAQNGEQHMTDFDEKEYLRVLGIAEKDDGLFSLKPHRKECTEKIRTLIEPERGRQFNLIREAIARIINLIYK